MLKQDESLLSTVPIVRLAQRFTLKKMLNLNINRVSYIMAPSICNSCLFHRPRLGMTRRQ